MAGTVPRQMMAHGLLVGHGSIPLYAGLEAASFAGGIGTPVIAASGYVDEAAADQKTVIIGLSVKAGSNGSAGAATMEFVPALPSIIFEANLEDETNNNHALVQTNQWAQYALQLDATNDRWYLDENDTSNAAGVVVKLVDAIGTVKARVQFVFLVDTTIYGT